VAEDVTERRRDVSLREDAGRDLVEQRLEEVVRLPVDHGHVDRRAAQRLCRGETAEAAADDHDAMASGHVPSRAVTCSVTGRRIIPSVPLLMPSSRWSTVVIASISSPPAAGRTVAGNSSSTLFPAASRWPTTCRRPFPTL